MHISATGCSRVYHDMTRPVLNFCAECRWLVIKIFCQLQQLALQTFKDLKYYIWRAFNQRSMTSQIIRSLHQEMLPFESTQMPLEVFIKYIVPHLSCSDLSHLTLTNTHYLQLFKKQVVFHKLFLAPEVNLLKLSSLFKLNVIGVNLGTRDLTDREFKAFIKHCPNMTSLDLSGCQRLTDVAMKALAQSCPHLKELGLSYRQRITDKGIRALALNCRNLEYFSLCRITKDMVIFLLGRYNSGLRSRLGSRGQRQAIVADYVQDFGRQLLGAEGRERESLNTIIQWFNEIYNDPCLGHRDYFRGNWDITDASIYALAQNCRNLSNLNLMACTEITDAAIQTLAQNCPHLATLNLRGCDKITEQAIKALHQMQPPLLVYHDYVSISRLESFY